MKLHLFLLGLAIGMTGITIVAFMFFLLHYGLVLEYYEVLEQLSECELLLIK